MKVLLSTSIASASAGHGGPVVAKRHAQALAGQGLRVCVAAPESSYAPAYGAIRLETYQTSSTKPLHFPGHRPNAKAVDALKRIIGEFGPDLLYDVHGPAWALEAAAASRVPVVSMIGDYAWFCRQSFLVDSDLRRCSGPESLGKCFSCLNGSYSPQRRVAHIALKRAAHMGIPLDRAMAGRLASLRLWAAVEQSDAYVAKLRASVACFVIGDRHAEAFFLAHGISRARMALIAQCLPQDALVERRAAAQNARPPIDRALRVGFVGRPNLDKGIHVLARAFEALPKSAPIELWIVHAELATRELVEPHFNCVASFRAALESGRIKLLRPQSDEELYRIMASVDVGAVPSLAFESPSLVMLEFVAQRTPIVRSESAGMEHVIQDGINGKTFPYGDWEALRRVLLEILERPAVLDQWRAALPRVGSDAEYARELIRVFERVTTRKRVSFEEAAHA